MERRLAVEPPKAQAYSEFMEEYEQLNHMRQVSSVDCPTSGRSYYIPHHAVLRAPDASAAGLRLRVVFNASASTTTGTSLNSLLSPGPKLQSELPAILLKWRQHRFVATADIIKMYRQILVHPDDQDFQRILWRASPNVAVRDFWLLTVTYGTTCAPYLAMRALRQLALDDGDEFPLARTVLTSCTYVDDCIFGADTLTQLINTRDQLVSLLQKGQFELSKWTANHPKVLRRESPESPTSLQKEFSSMDEQKILGVVWSAKTDAFTFRIKPLQQHCYTKRSILSIIARLFDPLGWVTPVTISAKILMQKLWVSAVGWDDPVPLPMRAQWLTYADQLPALEQVSIPRWTFHRPSSGAVELHGFCDASTSAYAAVVYLRISHDTEAATTSLLIAKSKVAPLQTISVPRLELSAPLLLATLIQFTLAALQFSSCPVYCWTDSMVTLEWVSQSPHKWKTFVANRVAQIQDTLPSAVWMHVPSATNPADCASRGISSSNLLQHSLWWSGPPWLAQPNTHWPRTVHAPPAEVDMECKEVVLCQSTQLDHPWDLAQRFSSWTKLSQVTAWMLRFVNRLRPHVGCNPTPPRSTNCLVPGRLTPAEIHRAQCLWIRRIQWESFPAEITALRQNSDLKSSSALQSLTPLLDAIKQVIRIAAHAAQHPRGATGLTIWDLS